MNQEHQQEIQSSAPRQKQEYYELRGPIYDLEGNIVKEPGIYEFDSHVVPVWSSDE